MAGARCLPEQGGLKADLLLRGMGEIAGGLDRLAIQDEMQARLPVLRGHPGMVLIALVIGRRSDIGGGKSRVQAF